MTLNELIEQVKERGYAIRAVSVTDKVDEGQLRVAFGHLLINPKDFDKLTEKLCEYEIIKNICDN